ILEGTEYVSNLAIDRRILSYFEPGKAPVDLVHTAPLELLPIVFANTHSFLDSYDARSERRRAVVLLKNGATETKYILEATKLKDEVAKRKDGKHSLLYHWNLKKASTCADFFKIEGLAPHEFPAVGETKQALAARAGAEACEEVLVDLREFTLTLDPQGNALYTAKDGTIFKVLYLTKFRKE
ncbi:hypothetical protein EBR43_14245, partial [bacterium]|nr:hypothetical protein [bacterium]